LDLIPTMLAEGATWWQSLIRTALGCLLIGVPLALSARIAGRLITRGSTADRLSAQITVGWSQAVLSFELLGSFRVLSLAAWGYASGSCWAVVPRRADISRPSFHGAPSFRRSRGARANWVWASGT
jgi:hypothetical protein